MRVLVVKLTSMGDVLHLMPALSDLKRNHPDVVVDWMVEDSFAEVPTWHPAIERVIKVSTRRWRSWRLANIKEIFTCVKQLRQQRYDYVVDAQGLIKSAVFSRFAKLSRNGVRAGFSGDSIKESPAAWLYHTRIIVARSQHAIDRLRQLCAGVFNYEYDAADLDYGLRLSGRTQNGRGSIFLFHGTTWPSKHVPDQLWRDLSKLIADDGFKLKVCWGSEAERQRAQWIAEADSDVMVLPKSSLTELADELAGASGAIAVDTGLGHMAAALDVPTVSIYGSTDAELTGTAGRSQIHIQSDYPCSPCLLKRCDKLTQQVRHPPCYQTLSADDIWQALYEQIV